MCFALFGFFSSTYLGLSSPGSLITRGIKKNCDAETRLENDLSIDPEVRRRVARNSDTSRRKDADRRRGTPLAPEHGGDVASEHLFLFVQRHLVAALQQAQRAVSPAIPPPTIATSFSVDMGA